MIAKHNDFDWNTVRADQFSLYLKVFNYAVLYCDLAV